MTKLTEIEARAAKATPSSNLDISRWDHGGGRVRSFSDVDDRQDLVADFYDEDNREFYYAARSDVPDLCATVRALAEDNERLRKAVDGLLAIISVIEAHDTFTGKPMPASVCGITIGPESNAALAAARALATRPALPVEVDGE